MATAPDRFVPRKTVKDGYGRDCARLLLGRETLLRRGHLLGEDLSKIGFERVKWVRLAQAWQDLGRDRDGRTDGIWPFSAPRLVPEDRG